MVVAFTNMLELCIECAWYQKRCSGQWEELKRNCIQQIRKLLYELEIRSVERGICPIATSTINERTVPIIMAGCMAYARNGRISTSVLKSDVTIVFLDPDFL